MDAPLPIDRSELQQRMTAVIREKGLQSLTVTTLLQHLQSQLGVDLSNHKPAIRAVLEEVLATDECQRELAEIAKKKQSTTAERVGGKGRAKSAVGKAKEGASSTPTRGKRAPKADAPAADQPKKPLSPYFLFGKDARLRDDVKALPITAQSAKIAELWAALSEDAKAAYKAKNEEDKKRYDAEIAAFKSRGGVVVGRSSTKKSAARGTNAPAGPKRAKTAFFCFSDAKRAEVAAVTQGGVTQVAAELGRRWKALSDAERAPYLAAAEEDKKRYDAECAAGVTAAPTKRNSRAPAKRQRDEDKPLSSESGSDTSSDSDSDSSDSGSESSSGSGSDSDGSSSESSRYTG